MGEDLLKIINHYGVMPQLKYFQSEVWELNEAIILCQREEIGLEEDEKKFALYDYKRHIAEEIADVQVMLNQFRLYYGITDEEVKDIMDYKIERQLERIEKEK